MGARMATVVMDRECAERLREERRAAGSDRWDEVWEGTYMMAPLPNNEHQADCIRLAAIMRGNSRLELTIHCFARCTTSATE